MAWELAFSLSTLPAQEPSKHSLWGAGIPQGTIPCPVCPRELEEGHGSGPATVATCPPAEPGPGGALSTQPWSQECSPECWDLLLARGWSCFLPTVTKYFGTEEVSESLAWLGTTPQLQFQLVP